MIREAKSWIRSGVAFGRPGRPAPFHVTHGDDVRTIGPVVGLTSDAIPISENGAPVEPRFADIYTARRDPGPWFSVDAGGAYVCERQFEGSNHQTPGVGMGAEPDWKLPIMGAGWHNRLDCAPSLETSSAPSCCASRTSSRP